MNNNSERSPLISIIVPVYNCEQYLSDCLDSLLAQTYGNIEIFLVNDCSTGNVEDIYKKYSSQNKNIHLFSHKKNLGLFQARLTGLSHAQGEYIAFCDGDDIVSVDYYRLLIERLTETNADIVIGDFALRYADNSLFYFNLNTLRLQDLDLSGSEVISVFMKQQGLDYGFHTMWNKVCTKSLWNKCLPTLKNINFKLTMTEDIAFSNVLWLNAERVANVHGAYYYYNQHGEQSINLDKSVKNFDEYSANVASVFNFFEKNLRSAGVYETYETDFLAWKTAYANNWYRVGKEKSEFAFKTAQKLFGMPYIDDKEHAKNQFFMHKKTIASQYYWLEGFIKKIADEKYKVISFDIFDTLILRPFLEPRDILKLLTPYYNKIAKTNSFVNFFDIRLEAEDTARRNLSITQSEREDITLDEIYAVLSSEYGVSEELAEQIKQKEIDLEIGLCSARKLGLRLFNLAKYLGKRVVLISDMYLSIETIKAMLEKCGFVGYEKLFLSSYDGVLKSSGNLFKTAINELGITTSEMLHFGDNWHTDIELAKQCGIDADYLPSCSMQLKNTNPGIYSGKWFDNLTNHNKNFYDYFGSVSRYLHISAMFGLIANKFFDNSFFTPINKESDFNADPNFIGYGLLGSHLFAVADWLKDVSANAETVHFTSRDGLILKEVFDLISGGKKSEYIYTSRSSLASLDINKFEDLLAFVGKFQLETLSPKKIFEILPELFINSNKDELAHIVKKQHFVWNKNFSSYQVLVRFLKYFWSNLYDKKAHQEYLEVARQYFNERIGEDDIVFDMGYNGRVEAVLSSLLGKQINGAYIYHTSDFTALRKSLSNITNATFYPHSMFGTVPIREHIFSELAPSCIGYERDGAGNAIPVFDNNFVTNYQTQFVTEAIQRNAVQFTKDFIATFNGYLDDYEVPRFFMSVPFENFIMYPTDFDMGIFGVTDFEDYVWGGKRNFNLAEFWKNDLTAKHLREDFKLFYTSEKQVFISNDTTDNKQVIINDEIIYVDGLMMKLIRKINKIFPKNSRRRVFIKALFGGKRK